MRHPASRPAQPALAMVEQAMLGLAVLALVALVSLPAAHGASATFGWLPFWLLALPLSAWTTARLLRLHATVGPTQAQATVHVLAMRPRTQARTTRALPRAA